MKEELKKICEDYTSSPESGQGLYDELLVLFSVSGSEYQENYLKRLTR